ncbi:MAG: hypothetical protein H7641_15370, partial [Candidatus Heimdallarchaeota archaeon]|nr:hypothetical protein [Candidatus Heimdallarchaeota archaeon]
MSSEVNQFDKLSVNLIDYDDVPGHLFPFFTSYRMFFDEQIRCFGFFLEAELVAVT